MQLSISEAKFVEYFEAEQGVVYLTARSKGWWENERRIGELIALMHSELSEALEGARHGNPPSEHIPDFNSLEEEFADVVIRIMDTAAHLNLRVGLAVVAKQRFNEGRAFKHGGKEF